MRCPQCLRKARVEAAAKSGSSAPNHPNDLAGAKIRGGRRPWRSGTPVASLAVEGGREGILAPGGRVWSWCGTTVDTLGSRCVRLGVRPPGRQCLPRGIGGGESASGGASRRLCGSDAGVRLSDQGGRIGADPTFRGRLRVWPFVTPRDGAKLRVGGASVTSDPGARSPGGLGSSGGARPELPAAVRPSWRLRPRPSPASRVGVHVPAWRPGRSSGAGDPPSRMVPEPLSR
jgi:hypothetical protein